MGRKTTWPPAIQTTPHGQDYVRICLGGVRRLYTLGPSGTVRARREYLRVITEIERNREAHARGLGVNITVGKIGILYLNYNLEHCHKNQYDRAKAALAPVVRLYADVQPSAFGPIALETVRAEWVAHGYCRSLCNTHASMIRHMFRWAAGRELIGPEIAERLKTLGPLVKGRTAAPDHPKIKPVPVDHVDRTLPHLPPAVADMVRIQLLIGARPGELVLLRGTDIVRPWQTFDGVEVWLFVLTHHKTRWRGGDRAIAIGPKAQAILGPYLANRASEAYCFSPLETVRAWNAARGRGYRARKNAPPGEVYHTRTYGQAITSACRRAGIPHWFPNQLRHAAGTRIRADWTKEDARCVLGHTDAATTEIYAEMSERAGRVAARDG